MRLNSIKPAVGSKPKAKRVGRGIGSGLGKTCGRGHKGQHARAGGYHRVGFEGGQMPLQRRLPKRGFRSRIRGDAAQVRLDELAKVTRLVPATAKRAKVIASGKLERAVTIRGVSVTKGALASIEAVGGKVEE
jgi:large subunit ribosomal protein L15